MTDFIQKEYDNDTKNFVRTISSLNSIYSLPKTRKAFKLLLREMSAERGFTRHDGRDYFVHPIAVAQTAIDFGLIRERLRDNAIDRADSLLTACLLHDILEDVEWVTPEYLIDNFGYETYNIIDNVSKRPNEPIQLYFERIKSKELSGLVKILDRLNNISTLSKSSNSHRMKQLYETRKYYIPLIRDLRKVYVGDRPFYWQASSIIQSLLAEVERCIKVEAKDEYERYVKERESR